MPCYHPNVGVRYPNIKVRNADGEIVDKTIWLSRHQVMQKTKHYNEKLPITQQDYFTNFGFQNAQTFPVACHNCIGCRIYRSSQWGLRCMHEAQMHDDNCFITLTYADEYLPSDGELIKKDMRKFFDYLRTYLKRKGFYQKIRYLYCGEYGKQTQRPHYHALIFGFDFPDKELFKVNHSGQRLYTSQMLTNIWGKGNCLIGNVSYASACYVARYCIDKINGEEAKLHYAIKDEEGNPLLDEDGVIQLKPKEFAHMSNGKISDLGGGIGVQWFEQFWKDLYPLDECIMDGRTYPVPTYYDKLLKRSNRELYDEVKAKRQENAVYSALSKPLEQSQFRLLQKETVKMAQITQLARTV